MTRWVSLSRLRAAAPGRLRRRAALALVVTVLATGLVWGITTALGDSSSPSPAAGKVVLRIGTSTDADNLNPFVGYESTAYELYHLNYDFLTGFGQKHLEPVPEIAESWDKSADGLTWTFHIRHGMTWQDGTPLTAKDVAFTYNFNIKYQLGNYLGAMRHIKSVTATDDYTVVFVCDAPKADILAMWVPIVPEHVWGKFTSKDQVDKFTNDVPVVGSGPFQVVEWKKSQYIRLKANPNYWRGKPKVDEVIFQVYSNLDTMAQDVRSGGIQAAELLLPASVRSLQNDPTLFAGAHEIKSFDYLSFNTYKGPSLGNPVLRDPAFRRALAWAVDREKIVQVAYNGYADVGSSIFQPHFYDPTLDWHYQPTAAELQGFDLVKAGQMLDAAGYPLKNGVRVNKQGKPIKLRLWARTQSPSSQEAGKIITAAFQKLGLKIQFSILDSGVLSDGQYNTVGNTYKPDYDMYLWGWLPSGSDPQRALGYFTTDQIQNQNDCCWSNAEYDRLYALQGEELDPAKRLAIVHQMEQIFYNEAPYVVIAYPKQLEAYNTKDWEGWKQAPEGVGAVSYVGDNIDTYLFAQPKAAQSTGGGSHTGLIAGIIIAVAVVVCIVLWVFLRHKPAREES